MTVIPILLFILSLYSNKCFVVVTELLWFRKRRPILNLLFPRSDEQNSESLETSTLSTSGYANPKLAELARRFKTGIARAIGVPPEYISEERVRKWVEEWAKAWVKPEYWSEVLKSPSPLLVEAFGFEIGNIIKDARKKK